MTKEEKEEIETLKRRVSQLWIELKNLRDMFYRNSAEHKKEEGNNE